MEGKIILNIAISLDGFIASEKGSFEWIKGDGDNSLNTEKLKILKSLWILLIS